MNDYQLPPSRIRSDLEVFLDDGRTEEDLLRKCRQLDLQMIANSPTCGVGCNPALLFETARAALKESTDV